MTKFSLKKAYTTTSTGREKVVWHVMDGDFITDAFDLRRDAKYYMDLWNSEAARNAVPVSSNPAYYNADGGSMCNGLGRSYF